MKKGDIVLITKDEIEILGIDKEFLPKGATWLVLMLGSKKKLKKGREIKYNWMLEIIPSAWTDFLEQTVDADNQKKYEEIFIKPISEEQIKLASKEYFMYSQIEVGAI